MSNARLQDDVLVVGGGMAGTWAALGAAREGAKVTLEDKGCCGTRGIAASAWLLGADNNTGDGYLIAAEAGAELSGMVFTNYFSTCAAATTGSRGRLSTPLRVGRVARRSALREPALANGRRLRAWAATWLATKTINSLQYQDAYSYEKRILHSALDAR